MFDSILFRVASPFLLVLTIIGGVTFARSISSEAGPVDTYVPKYYIAPDTLKVPQSAIASFFPAPKPKPQPSRPVTQVTGQHFDAPSSGRCGGSLPSCSIMACESGGSLTARNPSGAAGKWQIMPGTWNGYGGYSSADQAPEHVQDAKARELWRGGAGRGHWAQCL